MEANVKSFLSVYAVLLLMTSWSAREQGAGGKREDIYQDIPAERKESLKQAVHRLVEAERAGDWKGVYALLDKQPGQSEDTFRRKMESMRRLHGFRPVKVTFMPPDDSWNIQGCATLAGEPGGQGHIADLSARWKDSRWYLSVISFVLFGSEKGGKLQGCLME
jgi:hypothetical protein